MPKDCAEPVLRIAEKKLADPSTKLPEKYRILFFLKGASHPLTFLTLSQGLKDRSALFRHEVAYCLGQRRNVEAIEFLAEVLNSQAEHPMVRHEAGEALGAIATPDCVQYLQKHQRDSCLEVAQTCQLALQRISFYSSDAGESQEANSRFSTVDPAPAFRQQLSVAQLKEVLIDESCAIFERYRALFALRNLGGQQAVQALAASFDGNSALLKHEVAYVLGQMQDKLAVSILRPFCLSEGPGQRMPVINDCSIQLLDCCPSKSGKAESALKSKECKLASDDCRAILYASNSSFIEVYCRRVLCDSKEHAMVRHEAAEALGAIADPECIELLRAFSSDPDEIVADSCIVALDMLDHELSGAFEYVGVEMPCKA